MQGQVNDRRALFIGPVPHATLRSLLPDAPLPFLEAVERRARVTPFQRGQRLWEAPAPLARLHWVTEGHLKVVYHRADGRELIVDLLRPGRLWGNLEARPLPYLLSGVGLDQGRLLSIDAAELAALMKAQGIGLEPLLRAQSDTSHSLIARFLEVTAGGIEVRLSSLLLRLAREEGQPHPRGILITAPLSRQDLADLVDTTVETAIRVMSRWNKEEVVLTQRQGFVIPDLALLEARTES